MSSIGELTFFLGLQVKQKDDGIFISQDKYVADILKKFDFVTMKTASTPIETNKALLKDEEAEDMDVHLYKSIIGSLMYLTASKPDIIFGVCACARYLKGQPKLGLWYPMDSPFDLEAFSDSDYAGASLDRKSTTGGCQFFSKRLISWQCKKQIVVANSTTEAEYVVAANCYGQGTDSGSGPRCQDTILGGAESQTRFEAISKQSNEPPLSRVNTLGSGEDNMRLLIYDIKTDRVNWLNLLLPVLVYAARHTLATARLVNTVRLNLMLSVQFWTSAKAKTVNGERQIQALVDKKKVIITETSIRSDLKLNDAEGTDCLPTATIFA
ncbi:hypothetical protein Tco_1541375 [Tanacetum coccineum]